MSLSLFFFTNPDVQARIFSDGENSWAVMESLCAHLTLLSSQKMSSLHILTGRGTDVKPWKQTPQKRKKEKKISWLNHWATIILLPQTFSTLLFFSCLFTVLTLLLLTGKWSNKVFISDGSRTDRLEQSCSQPHMLGSLSFYLRWRKWGSGWAPS